MKTSSAMVWGSWVGQGMALLGMIVRYVFRMFLVSLFAKSLPKISPHNLVMKLQLLRHEALAKNACHEMCLNARYIG